jgi:hypothetical protein
MVITVGTAHQVKIDEGKVTVSKTPAAALAEKQIAARLQRRREETWQNICKQAGVPEEYAQQCQQEGLKGGKSIAEILPPLQCHAAGVPGEYMDACIMGVSEGQPIEKVIEQLQAAAQQAAMVAEEQKMAGQGKFPMWILLAGGGALLLAILAFGKKGK